MSDTQRRTRSDALNREDVLEEKRGLVVEAARALCATAQASWHQPGMVGCEAKAMNQLRLAVAGLMEAERAS